MVVSAAFGRDTRENSARRPSGRRSSIGRSRSIPSLGYEVVGRVPETDIGSLTMLKLPNDEFVTLELVHDPSRGDVDPGGFNHLVIGVESMHETVDRLAAEGIEAGPPTSPNDSDDFWTAWLTDPDGYRIELVQWPAGHPAGMTRRRGLRHERAKREGRHRRDAPSAAGG